MEYLLHSLHSPSLRQYFDTLLNSYEMEEYFPRVQNKCENIWCESSHKINTHFKIDHDIIIKKKNRNINNEKEG